MNNSLTHILLAATLLSSPVLASAQEATRMTARPINSSSPAGAHVPLTSTLSHAPKAKAKPAPGSILAGKLKKTAQPAKAAETAVDEPIEPDWTALFADGASVFDQFSVIDANNDGKTWRYFETYGERNVAASDNNRRNGNDDWLITPPIHMKPGRVYTISFKARNWLSSYANSLEVKMGGGASAEGMTQTLLGTTTPGPMYEVYMSEVKVEQDGNYYIGFHDNTSQADMGSIYIDSIAVEKGISEQAPDSVSNLKVVAGQQGALTAKISFQTPTKLISGESIASVDKFLVKRDGILITTLPAAQAGESVSIEDRYVPSSGFHIYEVTPIVGDEDGRRASSRIYIGIDAPDVPSPLSLGDEGHSVLASWTATEHGANGGYANPADASVTFFAIEENNGSYYLGDSLATSAKGATSVSIPYDTETTTESDGTTQTLLQFVAQASSSAGKSDYDFTNAIAIGPTIMLPFKESISQGTIDNGFAWLETTEPTAARGNAAPWTLTDELSSDNDGGCILWAPYTSGNRQGSSAYDIQPGDEYSVNMPKVSLRGATNPRLYFDLYARQGERATLKVVVQTPDGTDHDVQAYDLSSTATSGWSTKEVSLSQFTSSRYIIVKFHGSSQGNDTYIGIDNINMLDQLEYNLSVADIIVPESVKAGSSAMVNVVVRNTGSHPANGYSVVLYANDAAQDPVLRTSELAPMATDTVSLVLPVDIDESAEQMSVRATVIYTNDLDEDDNTTGSKTIDVEKSQSTGVEGLTTTVKDGARYDIYTPDGLLIKTGVKRTDDLPRGIYIINGKKLIAK